MFGFGGVNTAPSGGFMQRMMGGLSNMRQNIPGMVNALGSAMPGAAGDMSRVSGGILKNRPGMRPNKGAAPGGVPASPYGGGMPEDQGPNMGGPAGAPNTGGGLVRMPSFMPQLGMGGGYRPQPMPQFGQGDMINPAMLNRNTGITGGMFGRGGGPLFNTYSNLSNEQGAPTGRQMFY